jgi:hypothetical protein
MEQSENDTLAAELDALDRQDVARKSRGHLSPKERARVRQAVRDHRARKADAEAAVTTPERWAENLAALPEDKRQGMLATQDTLKGLVRRMIDCLGSLESETANVADVVQVCEDVRDFVSVTGLCLYNRLSDGELQDLRENKTVLDHFRQDHPSHVDYGVQTRLPKSLVRDFFEICADWLKDSNPELAQELTPEPESLPVPVRERKYVGPVESETQDPENGDSEQRAAASLDLQVRKFQREVMWREWQELQEQIDRLGVREIIGGVNA